MERRQKGACLDTPSVVDTIKHEAHSYDIGEGLKREVAQAKKEPGRLVESREEI